MRPLSDKETKTAYAMFAKAEKYRSLHQSFDGLESQGRLVLDKFETHLTTAHQIQIVDHTFKFLGVPMQGIIEIDFTVEEMTASLTIYHLVEEERHLKKIRVVAVPYDKIGNILYDDKFPQFIIGSIINYLQFNFNPVPLR